uniref:Uncharacterized protein n=1 Tax=Clandestinovirus TaxID=2831644 RepID=A0A8F8KPG2_9VIRU|nr:hypothetical protein KOM_12_115 [Clandestinovirus]
MWSKLSFARQSLSRLSIRCSSSQPERWYDSLPTIVQEAKLKQEQHQEKCFQDSIVWLDKQISSVESPLAKAIVQKAKSGERSLMFYYADIPVATFFNPQSMNKNIVDVMNAKYKDRFKFADYSSPNSSRYFTISW